MVSTYDDCLIKDTIDQYGNMVYRICLMYLKRQSDAEDAFQEVFIKVFEKAPSFTGEDHKKAWIITVTSNHCKNVLKKMKRENTLTFDEEILVSSNIENDKELLPVILNLPLDYRNVIYLYYYEGYSTREISNMLRQKDTTIRTWLKRARESIKLRIGGAFDE